MVKQSLNAVVSVLCIALAVGGCAISEQNAEQPSDLDQSESELNASNGMAFNGLSWNGLAFNGLAFNGLSWNGLAFNGLAFNGLAFNGMTFNGMTFNGMTYNGMTYNGLDHPVVNSLTSYLVQCALPAGDSVSYTIDDRNYTFSGQIGLAPEWKTGSCGPDCQRWMTACLLSRLNKLGEHVEISIRGDHPALAVVPHEQRDFRTREATYYGNLFEGPDRIYACYSPGSPSISRVCGDSLSDCPMQVVGACNDACRGPGRHQSFRDCSARVPIPRRSQDVFAEAITVFLRH
jgi:hypothetical protein